MNRRPKTDPDTLYAAWQGFTSDHPAERTTVARGQILRGDDPIVLAHRHNFVVVSERLPSVQEMLARADHQS